MTQAVESPYVPPVSYGAQDENGYCYAAVPSKMTWWVEQELQRRKINHDVYREGHTTIYRVHNSEFSKMHFRGDAPILPTSPFNHGHTMSSECPYTGVTEIGWTTVQWEW